MYCENCGKKLNDEAKNCDNCGYKVTLPATAEKPQQQLQTQKQQQNIQPQIQYQHSETQQNYQTPPQYQTNNNRQNIPPINNQYQQQYNYNAGQQSYNQYNQQNPFISAPMTTGDYILTFFYSQYRS